MSATVRTRWSRRAIRTCRSHRLVLPTQIKRCSRCGIVRIAVAMNDLPVTLLTSEDRGDPERKRPRRRTPSPGHGPLDGYHIPEITTEAGTPHLVGARLPVGEACGQTIEDRLHLIPADG